MSDNIEIRQWDVDGSPRFNAFAFSAAADKHVGGSGSSEAEARLQLAANLAFYDDPPACVAQFADGQPCPNRQFMPDGIPPNDACKPCWEILNDRDALLDSAAGRITFKNATEAVVTAIVSELITAGEQSAAAEPIHGLSPDWPIPLSHLASLLRHESRLSHSAARAALLRFPP